MSEPLVSGDGEYHVGPNEADAQSILIDDLRRLGL